MRNYGRRLKIHYVSGKYIIHRKGRRAVVCTIAQEGVEIGTIRRRTGVVKLFKWDLLIKMAFASAHVGRRL